MEYKIENKLEHGITLIALIITIVVLLILAGVAIGTGININEDADKDKQFTEINMVQQAILQEYIKYTTINDYSKIIGTSISLEDVNKFILDNNLNISLKVTNDDKTISKYYKLGKNELLEIGISNTADDAYYIVNYKTGEVIDAKNKITHDGEALYVYATK